MCRFLQDERDVGDRDAEVALWLLPRVPGIHIQSHSSNWRGSSHWVFYFIYIYIFFPGTAMQIIFSVLFIHLFYYFFSIIMWVRGTWRNREDQDPWCFAFSVSTKVPEFKRKKRKKKKKKKNWSFAFLVHGSSKVTALSIIFLLNLWPFNDFSTVVAVIWLSQVIFSKIFVHFKLQRIRKWELERNNTNPRLFLIIRFFIS